MSSRRKATAPRRLGADEAARYGQNLSASCFERDWMRDDSAADSCLSGPAKKRKRKSWKLLVDDQLESLLEGCDYALQVECQDTEQRSAHRSLFCIGQLNLTAHTNSSKTLEDACRSSNTVFIGCKSGQTDCCVAYCCSDQWHCLDATLCVDEDVRLVLSNTKSARLEVAKVLDSCVVLEVLLSPTNVHCFSNASDSPRTSVNRQVQTLIHHFFGISHVSGHTEKFQRQDLDLLYARIAAAQSSQPDVDAIQHAALRPTLRPYQKQVVSWMLKQEQPIARTLTDNFLYTPLVDCYGKLLYYNKYAGFFVEKKVDFVATSRPGGILADEMGLGKTVEMLACILLHPMPTCDQTSSDQCGDLSPTRVECLLGGEEEEMVQCPECHAYHHVACRPGEEEYLCPHCWVDPAKEKIAVKTTLIVSPSSISFQWLEEIERHQKDDVLRVMEYRGVQNHGFVSPQTFAKYDIVLTTYEVLKKELNFTDLPHVNSAESRSFRNPRKFLPTPCPLTALLWWRVCLDEAQMVEGTATRAAQMALKLSAVNRWCVTGTPVQKSLHDLYGLLLFLGEEPYNVKLWWNECLLMPYCHGDPEPLVAALSRCFKRTIKENVLEQIGIPPQDSVFHTLSFSPVEEVFYERQADQCAAAFREQVCKFPDHSIRIEQLDRHSVGLLLQPLVRLRQACCHPRAVRGAFLPMRTDSLTMEELLTSLIKKATSECEEAHRRMVSSMNGIAGIHIIRDERREAADVYREVLWSVKDHSRNIKTDRLQQLHALHNLAQLLDDVHSRYSGATSEHTSPTSNGNSCSQDAAVDSSVLDITHDPAQVSTKEAAGLTTSTSQRVSYIPQAPNDDKLHEEAAKLRQSYLDGHLSTIGSAKKQLVQTTHTVKETIDKFSLPRSQPWWNNLLSASIESGKDEWLIRRVKDDLESKKSHLKSSLISDQFSTAHGLQYVMDTQLRQLEAAREELLSAIQDLSASPSSPNEVSAAVECHLRPSKKKRNKCKYCVVHELFNWYEGRLFCFSEDTVHEEAQDKEDALFATLRRGNWGDSNLEKIIKSLNRSSYLAGDSVLCSDGQVHVQLFAALKKEFRAMRAVYMSTRDYVAAVDELDMATVRLEMLDEEADEPLPLNVLRPWQVPEQWSKLLCEKELYQNDLKKKLGQLFYLKNLEKAGSHRGEFNPEPCPICQNPLGRRWSVMQCGHNFCLDCIKMVCSSPSCMRSGSLLCAVCRNSCAHGDVFYVDTAPPPTSHSRFSVKGSHTTKIGAIIETILEIKADDPSAKALLFSSWSIVIDVLKKALEANEVPHITLKPGPNFKNNLALFRHDPSIMVLVLPLSLGAKGLNLTEATHVLLAEPILNLGDELQAIGRVHRIGQTRKTYVHHFMVKNTIEERIADFFRSSEASQSCLEDHAKMTINDLKNLFK
uniref:Putative dead box-containing helicase-like transcription factor/dna repair protein n=1 Tax=Rhipicephalus pulchellus TaxID=72859 RepID=L7LZM8_RHIPC